MPQSAAATELQNLADLCAGLQLHGRPENINTRLLDPIASALGAESAALRRLSLRQGCAEILDMTSLGLASTVNDDYRCHFHTMDPFLAHLDQIGRSGVSAPLAPDTSSNRFSQYYRDFLVPNDLVHHAGFLVRDAARQQAWIFNFHRGSRSAAFSSVEMARTRAIETFLQGQASQQSPRFNATLWETLSIRERDICTAVSRGLGNKQIAASLGISTRTVENHLRNIYGKFAIKTRTQLIAHLYQ